jgi:hypothetical protein
MKQKYKNLILFIALLTVAIGWGCYYWFGIVLSNQ